MPERPHPHPAEFQDTESAKNHLRFAIDDDHLVKEHFSICKRIRQILERRWSEHGDVSWNLVG